MKKETILKKAISKAVKNGWKHTFSHLSEKEGIRVIHGVCLGDDKKLNDGYMSIIFLHSFAKAYWGEKIINSGIPGHMVCNHPHPAWQYHLTELALAKDRLKYLEKFLNSQT